MHSLQKRFHDFIYSNHLVKNDEKILLAVSGGLDSMVMCHLFKEEKIEYAIAHCNFGLRGDESDEDEAFVMNWADENEINCFVKSFDLGKGSIQLEARNERYEWFQELLIENEFDKIATAHHLNDSLETLLINLTRGTGFKGVSGVPLTTKNIIRPLLFATKMELNDYALDQSLAWREDSSNEKDDYDRNRIRHHVIPELELLNPSLFKTVPNTFERLRFANELILEKVSEVKNKYLSEERSGGFRLNLDWIKDEKDQLILSEILSEFGVNYTTVKEVYGAQGKSGRSFPSGAWLITMDRDSLFFDKNEDSIKEIEIFDMGLYDIGTNKLKIELIDKEEVVFNSVDDAYFDADKISFPLKIRKWKEGDRFQPLGMNGAKKVSDLLIDLKIPMTEKNRIAVIESKNDILWVIGQRISDPFKIADDTESVLKISKIE